MNWSLPNIQQAAETASAAAPSNAGGDLLKSLFPAASEAGATYFEDFAPTGPYNTVSAEHKTSNWQENWIEPNAETDKLFAVLQTEVEQFAAKQKP